MNRLGFLRSFAAFFAGIPFIGRAKDSEKFVVKHIGFETLHEEAIEKSVDVLEQALNYYIKESRDAGEPLCGLRLSFRKDQDGKCYFKSHLRKAKLAHKEAHSDFTISKEPWNS